MSQIPIDSPSGSTRRAVIGGASALAALAFGSRFRSGAAQEATGTPDPERVFGDILASALPTSVPDMELFLRRTIMTPGGGIAPHTHPGSIILMVDAGTWGFTPLSGSVGLTRAAGDGTFLPPEEPPLGIELILTAGDSVFVEDIEDEMRNAGEDDVVLLIAALIPMGEDFQTGPD